MILLTFYVVLVSAILGCIILLGKLLSEKVTFWRAFVMGWLLCALIANGIPFVREVLAS